MPLETRLTARTLQRPEIRVSGVLTQTMRLLAMPVETLAEEVETALARNPALELAPARRCPTCGRTLPESGACPFCLAAPQGLEPIVFLSDPEDFRPTAPAREAPEDDAALSPESLLRQTVSLAEYVLRQIAPDLAPEERPIAAFILTHLDDDGLLTVAPAEVALQTRSSLRQVRRVLALIQQADPPGVGARDPQEAMLAQLRLLNEAQQAVPPQAEEAIRLGVEWLRPTRIADLAHRLGISQAEARRLWQFIRENLNPFPARAAWGDLRQGQGEALPVYTRPDIVFSLLNNNPDGPLVVEVLTPGLRLRLNSAFRRATAQVAPTQREGWVREIQQAELLLKSLHQRSHTLLRLARLLAREQREFILRGPRFLRPMTRAAVAQRLEVHESTISRAVSSKTALLPDGRLVPLSTFFDRSLPAREALKRLIANETRPLSDAQLARLLSKQMGYPIARRTVTKYRSMEGIPPAHLRKAWRQR